jgi:hypothetical protein
MPESVEQGQHCPLLNKPCIKMQCRWYVRLLGKHPQTGNPVDHWDCAVAWLPVMLVEVAQESRQGAAATESFRNEMVRVGGQLVSIAADRRGQIEDKS